MIRIITSKRYDELIKSELYQQLTVSKLEIHNKQLHDVIASLEDEMYKLKEDNDSLRKVIKIQSEIFRNGNKD
jgi:hypothetical protein